MLEKAVDISYRFGVIEAVADTLINDVAEFYYIYVLGLTVFVENYLLVASTDRNENRCRAEVVNMMIYRADTCRTNISYVHRGVEGAEVIQPSGETASAVYRVNNAEEEADSPLGDRGELVNKAVGSIIYLVL